MIWLTWRQHRKQALFTLVGFAILAAAMIPTGLQMHHTFAHDGIAACLRKVGNADLVPGETDLCGRAMRAFTSQYTTMGTVGLLFIFLPLLVGLFWGAPLVAREIEHGTHRLVWTQGISRRRWALVKFGLVGTATIAFATLYGLGLGWWWAPLSQAAGQGRLGPGIFDVQGVTPIAYTVFAVALGIFAGTVWHKVLPAMAVTLAGFLGVRIALAILARPRYVPARTLTYPLQSALQLNMSRGDWVQAVGVRNGAGKLVAPDMTVGCPAGAQGSTGPCGTEFGAGAYNWQLYQPGSRFWLFQGIESGIFIALAALLLYLAMRRIRRIA